MYNNLVERCFRDCVDSFRRKDLEGTEEKVSDRPRASRLAAHMAWPAASPCVCAIVACQVTWGASERATRVWAGLTLVPTSRPPRAHAVRAAVLREVHEALGACGRALCGALAGGRGADAAGAGQEVRARTRAGGRGAAAAEQGVAVLRCGGSTSSMCLNAVTNSQSRPKGRERPQLPAEVRPAGAAPQASLNDAPPRYGMPVPTTRLSIGYRLIGNMEIFPSLLVLSCAANSLLAFQPAWPAFP